MADEFSYTFKRCWIALAREDVDTDWYIRVRAPDGGLLYDGWWRDSAGKTLKEALYEAKAGSLLLPKRPSMDPERTRATSPNDQQENGNG